MHEIKKWIQEDDDFLKLNYGKWYTKAIAKELNRSEASIRKRAYMLGLTDSKDRFGDFSPNEINYLKKKYSETPTSEIAEYLNKSESRIRSFAIQLGLQKKSTLEWKEEEIHFLKENISLPYRVLSEKLNRTELIISKKLKLLGIEKKNSKYWTESQVEYLKENYQIKSIEEIGKLLHKGKDNIKSKVIDLGLELKPNRWKWSEEEIEIVKNSINKYTTSELVSKINRSSAAIKKKKEELGFTFNSLSIPEWKDTIMCLNNQGIYISKIAKEIGYPLRVTKQYFLNENIQINHDPTIQNAYNRAVSKGFNNPVDIKDSKLTFCEWFVYWYDHYRKSQVSEKTKERYFAVYVSVHDEGLGKLKISNISRRDIQKYINWYGKNHSKATVLGYLQLIRAAFKDALDEGILKNNPAGNINLVYSEQKMSVKERKKKRDEKKWLEIEEYQKFRYYLLFNLNNMLNKKPDTKTGSYPLQVYYVLMFIGLKTGARLAEILGITSADVLKNEIVIEKSWDYTSRGFKPTKNEASLRNTVVDEETIALLKEYIEWRDKYLEVDEDTLFVLKKYRIHASQINNILASVLNELKIQPITMHKLRHTQASYLMAKGIPEGLIAKRLGHSDTTMVRRVYGHLLKDAEESGNQRIMELI